MTNVKHVCKHNMSLLSNSVLCDVPCLVLESSLMKMTEHESRCVASYWAEPDASGL